MILTQLWLNYISNVRETIWFLDLKCDFCKGSHNLNAMIAWLHKASEKTWLTSTKSNGIFNDQSITIRPLINPHESIIIFRHFPQWSHGHSHGQSCGPGPTTPYKCRRCVDLVGGDTAMKWENHRDTAWFYPLIIQWIWGVLFDLFSHRDLMGCQWW